MHKIQRSNSFLLVIDIKTCSSKKKKKKSGMSCFLTAVDFEVQSISGLISMFLFTRKTSINPATIRALSVPT